jgi:hypothetical protein
LPSEDVDLASLVAVLFVPLLVVEALALLDGSSEMVLGFELFPKIEADAKPRGRSFFFFFCFADWTSDHGLESDWLRENSVHVVFLVFRLKAE